MDGTIHEISSMPPESTILRYNNTRNQVFFRLLCAQLDQFVARGLPDILSVPSGGMASSNYLLNCLYHKRKRENMVLFKWRSDF